MPISTSILIAKISSINEDFSKKNKKAQLKSVYLFLKRYNLSIRQGQKLSLNTKNDYYSFLYETVKYRKIYNINDNFDLIINCDETPLFFEMVDKTTIEKKGEKILL